MTLSVRCLRDLEWHGLLWRSCPNGRLVRTIEDSKQLARRFDGAYRRGLANLAGSCDQHAAIADALDALAAGKAELACAGSSGTGTRGSTWSCAGSRPAPRPERAERRSPNEPHPEPRTAAAAGGLAAALFATAGTAAHPQDSGSAGDAAAARANARWDFYFEESRIDRLVDRLSRDRRPETVAITGVRLIAVTGGEALPAALVADLQALHAGGYVLRTHQLEELAGLLETAHRPTQAAAVRTLETPAAGPVRGR